MTRRQRSYLFALLALIVVAALAVWLLRKPADPTPSAGKSPAGVHGAAPARPTLTVSVARPETSELKLTLAANGNVAAWQEAVVGSELNGLRLAEVRVNVGDVVKKGQVLAVFSPETINADVAQARASLAEAQATAADAAGNAARARTLAQTGALSQQQINQYQTAEQTAKARVQAAQAVLTAQQVRGRNTQVLAPDDGVISSRTATVGSVLAAGTELFKLIRQGRLEWRAEVTSAELGRLAIGMPVVVVGASGAQVQGKLRSIAPTVDPQTRNALAYVDIPSLMQNTGARATRPTGDANATAGPGAATEATGVAALRAGMFAGGEFQLGRSNALTVPQAAIVPRDGFNHLLLLQPDQRVSQLKVETGRRVGERVEILTRLPADAQVVVQGAGFLNDGDLVRVVEAPTNAPITTPTPAPPPPAAAAPSAK